MKNFRWFCLLPFLFFTAKPALSQCGGPNIALGKKVTVSHYIHLAEGARAVDGSIANGSRWKTPDTARVNGELIEWINVNLDSTRNICTVRLIWETLAFPSSFRIETSDDASAWKEIFSTTNNKRYDTSVTVTGRGKYLRVYHVKPYYDWNNSYSMLELQAYEGAGSSNPPPVTHVTSPSNGSTYNQSDVYFGANATDNGRITKVEFYLGNTKVGEDTTAPYSAMWTEPVAGTWTVYCKAYDDGTPVLVTTSEAITFTLQAVKPPNRYPLTSMTSPANNATFPAGSNITLNATASDDWGISRVEFYQGATKLGDDTRGYVPYTFEWKNVPAGTYSITSKVYDNGTPVYTATSEPIIITVGGPVTSPETDPVYTAEKSNLVRMNGSYANPSWIQTLDGAKIIAPGAGNQVVFNNAGRLGTSQHFTFNPANGNATFGGPANYFSGTATFSNSFGDRNLLGNLSSNAFGFNNDVQARGSTVFGEHHKVNATAQSSNAFGELHTVRGVGSAVFGMSNYTSAYGSFVIGHYSPDIAGATNSIVPTDPLFVIANGTSAFNRSSAMVVYKSGYTTFSGRTKHLQGIEFQDGSIQTTAVMIDTTAVWSLNGNRNLPEGSFIGTNDKKPLIFSTGGIERLRIDSAGMVAIRSANPGNSEFNLYVEKGIRTGKVKVQPNAWADYVFESKYSLQSLNEVEAYIKRFKRLPEMPSADEVKKNGVDLGDTQVLLLKKIEELTLYVIDLNKKVEALSNENEKLNKLVKENKK